MFIRICDECLCNIIDRGRMLAFSDLCKHENISLVSSAEAQVLIQICDVQLSLEGRRGVERKWSYREHLKLHCHLEDEKCTMRLIARGNISKKEEP